MFGAGKIIGGFASLLRPDVERLIQDLSNSNANPDSAQTETVVAGVAEVRGFEDSYKKTGGDLFQNVLKGIKSKDDKVA